MTGSRKRDYLPTQLDLPHSSVLVGTTSRQIPTVARDKIPHVNNGDKFVAGCFSWEQTASKTNGYSPLGDGYFPAPNTTIGIHGRRIYRFRHCQKQPPVRCGGGGDVVTHRFGDAGSVHGGVVDDGPASGGAGPSAFCGACS